MTSTPEIDDMLDELLGSSGAPVETNGEELAEWLGLSARQVVRLPKDGRAVRIGRNRYDLKASVVAYCGWLREQVPGGRPATGDARTRLAEERERLVREQADAVALKNAQARSELVPAPEVEREWSGVLRTVRAAMLSVPARVQARLAHLSADDVAVIDREVRDALTETAKGSENA